MVGTIVPETETSGRDLVQMIAELLEYPDRYVLEHDVSALKARLDALRAARVTHTRVHLQQHAESLPTCLALVKGTDMNAAATELFETQDASALEAFPYVVDPAQFADLARRVIADLAITAPPGAEFGWRWPRG